MGQLVFSSATRAQGELQDFALNRVRPLFATLPGVSAPPPFGGNQRSIVITLDPDKLHQYHISPGRSDFGHKQIKPGYAVREHVDGIDQSHCENQCRARGQPFGTLEHADPSSFRHGRFLRDIGTIENGTDLITAYAHVNGKRTVYIPVTKRADASTLAVIHAVKAATPISEGSSRGCRCEAGI